MAERMMILQLLLTYLRLIFRRNGMKNLCASALLSLCILLTTLFPVFKNGIRQLPSGDYLEHYLSSMQMILMIISFLGLLIFLWRSLRSEISEFGIMMSLGATRKDIKQLVLLQTTASGLITLAFGLLAGGLLSLLLLDLIVIGSDMQLMIEIDTRGALVLAVLVSVAIGLMGIRFYREITGKSSAALLSGDR